MHATLPRQEAKLLMRVYFIYQRYQLTGHDVFNSQNTTVVNVIVDLIESSKHSPFTQASFWQSDCHYCARKCDVLRQIQNPLRYVMTHKKQLTPRLSKCVKVSLKHTLIVRLRTTPKHQQSETWDTLVGMDFV